jgi:hypothetical protein
MHNKNHDWLKAHSNLLFHFTPTEANGGLPPSGSHSPPNGLI